MPDTSERIAPILAEIGRTRKELIETVNSFPESLFALRPTPEEWSVGEVVAHLALVEQGIVQVLNRLLERGKQEGPSADAEEEEEVAMTLPPLPTERLRASQRATPEQPLAKAEALQAITVSRDLILGIVNEARIYPLHKVVFPHIILGDLNFYQWLLFIGVHERRHMGQIERIRETLSTKA